MSNVHFRVLESDGLATVVEVQVDDLEGYNQDAFFVDFMESPLQFETKELAVDWMVDNLKRELIDPKLLSKKDKSHFYK